MATLSVLLCARTDMAVCNIGGQTTMQLFSLPVNEERLRALSASVAHSMSVVLRNLRVIIIDEISMVGAMEFAWIDKRLRDMFDPEQQPFGDMSILLFGDFLQLPPVFAAPVYRKLNANDDDIISSLLSTNLWNLFQLYRLTEIMRWREDLDIALVLNYLAIDELTPTLLVLRDNTER